MYRDPMDIFTEFDEMFERLHAGLRQGFSMSLAPGMMDRDGGGTCISMTWSGAVDAPAHHAVACTGNTQQAAWEEPATEIHQGDTCWTVTARLPGVTDENVCIAVRSGGLVIDAVCSDRYYHTVIPVPKGMDTGSIRHSIRNGVLEICCDMVSP